MRYDWKHSKGSFKTCCVPKMSNHSLAESQKLFFQRDGPNIINQQSVLETLQLRSCTCSGSIPCSSSWDLLMWRMQKKFWPRSNHCLPPQIHSVCIGVKEPPTGEQQDCTSSWGRQWGTAYLNTRPNTWLNVYHTHIKTNVGRNKHNSGHNCNTGELSILDAQGRVLSDSHPGHKIYRPHPPRHSPRSQRSQVHPSAVALDLPLHD